MLLTTLLLTIYGHSSSGAKLLLFVKTERNNAPLFVKTERNDLHGRCQTYILNKSSIVTTLCTLPEYSLRDCAIFMPLFLLCEIPLGILHIMLTEALGLILLGLLDKLGRNATP